ncbi:hypothetical protein BC940DRAFT_354181 [Gongronella butleri]|nr:hypothetical protein BC940DRAFT_354181 [Gongronella butleri]
MLAETVVWGFVTDRDEFVIFSPQTQFKAEMMHAVQRLFHHEHCVNVYEPYIPGHWELYFYGDTHLFLLRNGIGFKVERRLVCSDAKGPFRQARPKDIAAKLQQAITHRKRSKFRPNVPTRRPIVPLRCRSRVPSVERVSHGRVQPKMTRFRQKRLNETRFSKHAQNLVADSNATSSSSQVKSFGQSIQDAVATVMPVHALFK